MRAYSHGHEMRASSSFPPIRNGLDRTGSDNQFDLPSSERDELNAGLGRDCVRICAHIVDEQLEAALKSFLQAQAAPGVERQNLRDLAVQVVDSSKLAIYGEQAG